MSAQEYKLLQIKPGDFQDSHGNTWCDVAFEGVSEPVKMVVKDPRAFSEGEKYYGEIKDMTSKAGKPYLRFYRQQRPEGESHGTTTGNHGEYKSNYVPRDDNAIRAQWAIGQAVQLHVAVTKNGGEEGQSIEATAKELYAMVERVKGSELTEVNGSFKHNPNAEVASQEYTQDSFKSGYDKFKASRSKTDDQLDAEAESLYQTATQSEFN